MEEPQEELLERDYVVLEDAIGSPDEDRRASKQFWTGRPEDTWRQRHASR